MNLGFVYGIVINFVCSTIGGVHYGGDAMSSRIGDANPSNISGFTLEAATVVA